MAYDEATWEVLGGKGKRMPDVTTQHFYASIHLDRTWRIGVRDYGHPDGAGAWWDDHCDDDGREVVRGVLPFEVFVAQRHTATRMLANVQREFNATLEQVGAA